MHGGVDKHSDDDRPSNFKEGSGFFQDSSPSRSYSIRSQKETFERLLGKTSAAKFFSPKNFFFAKGHLSPDADFIFKEWQDATYYFFNVVPQVNFPFNFYLVHHSSFDPFSFEIKYIY